MNFNEFILAKEEGCINACVYFGTYSQTSNPLDENIRNLVGMKYSWSHTCGQAIGPDPPRGRSRAGQNKSMRDPFSKGILYIRRLLL